MTNTAASSGTVASRLAALGIVLPTPGTPRASYVPVRQTGAVMLVAGQVPRVDGKDLYVGKVGRDITEAVAVEAARACALNMLAQLQAALDGDLDRVTKCLRVRGFVNATEDFRGHAAVINGASDLIVQVLGESGLHARTAIGVASLPNGFAVEVDGDFEINV